MKFYYLSSSLRGLHRAAACLFIIFALMILQSCGAMGPAKKVGYPSEPTPEIESEFFRIEELYRRHDYPNAFAGYDHLIKTYPYTKYTDEAIYKQGKIFFLNGRFDDAAKKFDELAGKTPSAVYLAKAYQMAGYAYFKAQNYVAALDELKRVRADDLDAKLQVQYYSLLIETVKNANTEADLGAYAVLKLYDVYEDYAGDNLKNISAANIISFSDVVNRVNAWVLAPMASAQMPKWMRRYSSTPAKVHVDFKIAKIYYEEKNSKKARTLFSHFLNQYPKSDYTPTVQKILTELGGAEDVKASANAGKANYKIGVLVPLSGPFESFGRAVLDGVRCAVGENNVCIEATGIVLVVRDSGVSSDAVKQAVDELSNEGVIAIIGPLAGDLAADAGIVATSKKIPIFPITQKTGLMSQGDYIFEVGMQPKQQVQALVKAAFDKGYKTYGVYYPNNAYGQTMAQLFIEEVKAQGGRITAKAEYNRTSHDPFAEARKLKESIGTTGNPGKGIGFDALFLPDSFQAVNTMVSALEFNAITGVPMLGTNAWNDPGLTQALASKFPGSFFIDLYDANSQTKAATEFRSQFVAGFGRSPRVLEAYGFDTMMLIRTIAASRGEHNIKDGLSDNQGYVGVTGIRGFHVGDAAVIESSVVQVRGGGE